VGDRTPSAHECFLHVSSLLVLAQVLRYLLLEQPTPICVVRGPMLPEVLTGELPVHKGEGKYVVISHPVKGNLHAELAVGHAMGVARGDDDDLSCRTQLPMLAEWVTTVEE
jgi:hypothetical protein